MSGSLVTDAANDPESRANLARLRGPRGAPAAPAARARRAWGLRDPMALAGGVTTRGRSRVEVRSPRHLGAPHQLIGHRSVGVRVSWLSSNASHPLAGLTVIL